MSMTVNTGNGDQMYRAGAAQGFLIPRQSVKYGKSVEGMRLPTYYPRKIVVPDYWTRLRQKHVTDAL